MGNWAKFDQLLFLIVSASDQTDQIRSATLVFMLEMLGVTAVGDNYDIIFRNTI